MNLLSISDLTRDQIIQLLDRADAFKDEHGKPADILAGKNLAMIFEKPSTRTRVSLEVAASELGCHPLYLVWGSYSLVGVRPWQTPPGSFRVSFRASQPGCTPTAPWFSWQPTPGCQ